MSVPIERFRGDTAPDQISIVDSNGVAVSLTGLSFRLTVDSLEEPPDNTTQILQMVGVIDDPATGIVLFSPTVLESDALIPGFYFYDIQLFRSATNIIRTIAKSEYNILQDITKESN